MKNTDESYNFNFEPNPLFFQMVEFYHDNRKNINPVSGTTSRVTICNSGGSRCFHKDTLVSTPNGNVKISNLKANDLVFSYNHDKKKIEEKRVSNVKITKNESKRCFEILLKNGGVIKCTEDHKFYFGGEYVEIKDILSKINTVL